MKKVLDYIIDQRLESYEDLPKLIEPLREKFTIKNNNGEEATEEMIKTIMDWEKNTWMTDSLEKILNVKFTAKDGKDH